MRNSSKVGEESVYIHFLGAREYVQSSNHLGNRWLLFTKNGYLKLMISQVNGYLKCFSGYGQWKHPGTVKFFLRHVSAIQWSIYRKHRCLILFNSSHGALSVCLTARGWDLTLIELGDEDHFWFSAHKSKLKVLLCLGSAT